MSLEEDIEKYVKKVFSEGWSKQQMTTFATPEKLESSNHAISIDGVIFCAEMSNSTKLVSTKPASFAAEIYKVFLRCVTKIVMAEGGRMSICDGSRAMAVFTGDSKNTSAVRAALQLNYANTHIINPAISASYPAEEYKLEQKIGVDSSKLFVAKSGVASSEGLIWVGSASNYAAKLCALSDKLPIRITADVYNLLNKSVKYTVNGVVWQSGKWEAAGKVVYRSDSHLDIPK